MSVLAPTVKESPALKRLIPSRQLRQRFVTLLAPDDIRAVEQTLGQCIAEARDWCTAHSEIINPTMVVPISLLAFLEFPDLSPRRLSTMVELISWVYAFDDFVDVPDRSMVQISEVTTEAVLIVGLSSPAREVKTDYGRALLDIRDTVVRWSLASELYGVWSMCLLRLIEGIIVQGKAAPLRQLSSPIGSLDRYLFFASHGIGFPLLTVSGLMASSDIAPLAVLSRLLMLAEGCGAMIRLANDVRSFEHELVDGSLNGLSLVMEHDPPAASGDNQAPAAARLAVVRRIKEHEAQASLLVDALGEFAPLGSRLLRTARFAVDIFLAGDLRTWSRRSPAPRGS